jgi:hypothetical protein
MKSDIAKNYLHNMNSKIQTEGICNRTKIDDLLMFSMLSDRIQLLFELLPVAVIKFTVPNLYNKDNRSLSYLPYETDLIATYHKLRNLPVFQFL